MAFFYPQFMLKHGIRMEANLGNPPLTKSLNFELPTQSIYHYLDLDRREFGVDDPIFESNPVKKVVALEKPVDYREINEIKIHAKNRAFQFEQAKRHFYQEHKDLVRPEIGLKVLPREPKTLLVVDYNHVLDNLELLTSNRKDYERFYLIHHKLVDGIIEHDQAERQHFLFFNIPVDLPARSLLEQASGAKEVNDVMLKKFGNDENWFIWHLWMWFEENPRSIFHRLNDELAARVNLFLVNGRQWTVLNLGLVKKWIKTEKNPKARFTIEEVQRKLLVTLVKVATLEEVVEETEGQDEQSVVVPEGPVGQSSPVSTNMAAAPKKTGGLYKRPTLNELAAQQAKMAKDDVNDDTVFVTDESEEEQEKAKTQEEDVLKALEELNKSKEKELEESERALHEGYNAYTPPDLSTPDKAVELEAHRLARLGLLSAAQLRGYQKLSKRYTTIKPRGDETLENFVKIDPEDLKIPEEVRLTKEIKGVPDPSMLNSSLVKMDKQYIEKVMNKDVASMVLNLQQSGNVVVTDYDVKRVTTLHDDYEVHTVRLTPLIGAASTMRFRLPVVRPDGTYLSNGTVCRMRKQRGDIPIRKVAHDKVAMTSYYSKMFVVRSDKVVNSYERWVSKNIMILMGTPDCKKVHYKDCHVKEVDLPQAYFAISMVVESFIYKGTFFNFSYKNIETHFKDWQKVANAKDELPIGKDDKGTLLTLSRTSGHAFKYYPGKVGQKEDLGPVEGLFGLDVAKKPYEVAELELFGKSIPLGIVIARYIGMGTFLKTIGCSWRVSKKGGRLNAEPNETILRFSDENLYVTCKTRLQTMLVNGFIRFERFTKHQSFYNFDKPDVYGNILDQVEITSRHTRELDMVRKLWIDPITKEELERMGEPTDMVLLFLSAAKRLATNVYHDVMDMSQMRDRGYERFSGIAYNKMIESMRGFAIRPLNANAQVSMNPEDVWYSIIQDQTTMPVDQSNPIQDLKDAEVVVFGGAGGRSAQTMSAETRRFHETAKGVISEGGVDNGDAGSITFLSANPNYDSVRGTTRRIKDDAAEPSRMVSTSFLLSPAAEFDD